jgi:hypothetical protein
MSEMDDKERLQLMNAFFLPWRDIVKMLHDHGLPMTATHQQTLEWLQTRLSLARDVEIALQEYQGLERRVSTLEGNQEKEVGM